jgi:hypothetical protein
MFGRVLPEREIDHTFDKAAVVQREQDRCLATDFPILRARRRPTQNWMFERGTDGNYSRTYLGFSCTDEPSVQGGRRLNCIGAAVEIHCCKHRMDKGSEAAAGGPLGVCALEPLDLNR